MAEFIYTMKNVRRAIGDKVILDNVTMAFYPGAKIGVVGPNGAGKSSLLKIMAGIDQPNNGEAFLQPGATVGILLQEPPLNEEKTVRGNVEEGLGELFEKKQRFEEIAEEMATNYSDELMEEMGKLQEQLDAADAWEIDSKIEQAMEALRCPPSDAPVTNLSGGERRRVALAKLLLSEPDLLLLDEPSLGLAPIIIQQIFDIIEQLRKDGVTVFLVEQNANQALKLADRGYVLENGHIVMRGSGEELLNDPKVRDAYLGG